MKILADLHCHAADDPHDDLSHSTEELIDAAAASGVQALALTLHERRLVTGRLSAYAAERGILLIPGVELTVQGKHVLVVNPDDAQAECTTFDELRKLGPRDAAIIAPHPFYPAPPCLGRALIRNIDLFHAIEYSSMYCTGINFNRFAEYVARKHGLPLIGTSDTHKLPYADSTLSVIDAEYSIEGIIDAVREGRVELQTTPRPVHKALRFGLKVVYDEMRTALGVR